MILWVARNLRAQISPLPVFFAVDDELLAAPLRAEGFETVMTKKDHQSGTDRIAEANKYVGAEFVINVQADEPTVSKEDIELIAGLLQQGAAVATLATRFQRAEDFKNPNQVKVVLGGDVRTALYFSRAPVPFPRDVGPNITDKWVAANECLKHIGMYGYTASTLNAFTGMQVSRLERIEKLEQLRLLEAGIRISVAQTLTSSIGIDTAEDVRLFEHWLERKIS